MAWQELLERALAADERESAAGRAAGASLHAMADELVRIEDWAGLLAARDELAQRITPDRKTTMAGFGVAVINQRLAQGPPEWAVQVTRVPRWRPEEFERLAQFHSWSELAPLLDDDRDRRQFAYERVLRGEDLTAHGLVPEPGKPSFRLEPWEPRYQVRVYMPTRGWDSPRAELPAQPKPRFSSSLHRLPSEPLPVNFSRGTDDALSAALQGLCAPEWHESRAVRAPGDARTAVAALGYKSARFERCSLTDALWVMATAGMSSGGHGADPGAVRAREKLWQILSAIAGASEESPPPPAELGRAGERVHWWRVDPEREPYEWIFEFFIALEDLAAGHGWAMHALDSD